MMPMFVIFAVFLFLACLNQANEMSGKSPLRFQVGLIAMMVGDAFLVMGILKHPPHILVILSLDLLMIAITIWLVSEKRIHNDRRIPNERIAS